MRIVHLTSVHTWCDTRIFLKMCRSLARWGHEVHLVAPRGDRSEIEQRDGVVVHPVPLPSNRFDRVRRTLPRVLEVARSLRGDLYHFHDPEFLWHARRFQRAVGAAVVYDAHEDVRAQTQGKGWLPWWSRKAVGCAIGVLEDRVVAELTGVIAATPAIARRFESHAHTAIIQNFPLADELATGGSLAFRQRRPSVMYVGGISRLRGACEAVAAMALLPEAFPARLVMAGRFAPETLENDLRQSPGWNRVDYRGYCDRRQLGELLGESKIGLVTFLPAPNHLESQPTKLFEYMSAGLPVVASDFPHWRDIVASNRCGLLVDPRRPEAIAEAIRWLLEHPAEAEAMGRAGREAVLRHYNWEAEFQKLIDWYDTLVRGKSGRAAA
jgi:glycosyltransferase involved in cell wall biosynthesis